MRRHLASFVVRALALTILAAAMIMAAGCERRSRCTGTKTYVVVGDEGGGSTNLFPAKTEGRCGDWHVCVEGDAGPRCLPWWRVVLTSWQFWCAVLLVGGIATVVILRRRPRARSGPEAVDRWRDPGPS